MGLRDPFHESDEVGSKLSVSGGNGRDKNGFRGPEAVVKLLVQESNERAVGVNLVLGSLQQGWGVRWRCVLLVEKS